jgi:PKD repeat protein
MQGGATRSLVAGTLAIGLVVMGIPLAALGLGEEFDLLNGSIDVAIAAPLPGDQFSRIEDVQFLDGTTHSACPLASWAWEFGDQSASEQQNPTHRFGSLGLKEATLFVVGSCGRVGMASVQFEIINLAPRAVLGASQALPSAGEAVTFTGANSQDLDGSVASYSYEVDGTLLPTQSSPTLDRTFTQAGLHQVALRVVDNEGRASDPALALLDVRPGPLASLVTSDVAQLPAGGSFQYQASAADAWGNALPASPAWSATCGTISGQGLFQAPTTTGPCSVSAQQAGVEATDTVTILPGPLASLTLDGPAEVVAGTGALFNIEGHDAFGNPAPLQASSLWYSAPTAAGSDVLCHAEQGVQGCTTIAVVPDALRTLVVRGPESMVAGTTASFDVDGFDQHGNAVPLAQGSFDFTAPTQAGMAMACHTAQDVTSCASVQVLPDALASIAVMGPGSVVAGQEASYALRGADQYGNPVALAQGSLPWTAPTQAGMAQVCAVEQGVQGCADVEVVPDALATITVLGPQAVVAAAWEQYDFHGSDQYGNAVPLQQQGVLWQAPTSAGSVLVCHTEQGASGCLAVEVLPDALASILVTGPSEVVAGSSASYLLQGFDQHGNAVALAQGNLDWMAPTTAGSALVCHTEQGVSACIPVEVVPDALATLAITGPTSVRAGSAATYALDGADQHGNPVALVVDTLEWTAPAQVGLAQVCHTEQGISSCLDVDVTPAGLDRIVVSGPDSLVAGSQASYTLAGFDPFGNPVALALASLDYAAPTAAGPHEVCHAEQGVQGCKAITVLAAPLASIAVQGPDQAVAGSTWAFTFAGRDAYGNAVALAQGSTFWQAPTVAGPVQVCHTEQGITGCADVLVVPDALAAIVVGGPGSLVAGSQAQYSLAGFDQYDNAVALALASLAWQAPTQAGPAQVCHAEQGVIGCKGVVVLADALDHIALTGPAQATAGSPAQFSLAGSDAHGNPVPLAQNSLDWQAPTQAGPTQACYTEQGIEGCAAIEVVPDALATIALDGPAALQVGEAATYLLSGTDQYGNPVALAQGSLDYQAPTAPGQVQVCHSEQGASGCRLVEVQHGPLDRIVVSGPDSLVAGSQASYTLAGFDAYGNPVALQQATLDWQAPTSAGPAHACYAEQGIEGCANVLVLADALHAITVQGPSTLAAGSQGTFDLAGSDQHGNAVALALQGLEVVAPTLAGSAQACHAEQGVEGCAAYEVVHGPLDAIALTGPSAATAGQALEFGVQGSDAFGNAVPLAASTFAWTAPTSVGPALACYSEQGVQGCAAVDVSAGPLARIVVSPGSATTNVNQGKDIAYAAAGQDAWGNAVPLGSVAWSASLGRIDEATGVYKAITAGVGNVTAASGGIEGSAPVSVLNALNLAVVTNHAQYSMGAPVRGHVLAQFADGDPVPGAKVTLKFRGTSLAVGSRCNHEVSGLTNGAGLLQFQAPADCSRLLGDYLIEGSATWKANKGMGSKAYRVTL